MTALSIQAVIFDMDGVLIDSEPVWQRVEYEVLAALGVPVTLELIRQTTGLRIDQCVDYWYHKSPWTDYDNAKVSREIVERVAAEILSTGEAMEGVKEAIEYCKSKGLKIGLATSSPRLLIDAVLTKLEVKREFMAIESAELLIYGKPHPEVYLNCAAALGVDPRYCLAIEDSFNGLVAARAANMQTLAIPAEELRGDAKWAIAHHQKDSLFALHEVLG
ncbi:hexitol phosphatase HxpB [Shewanella acanthi]|uniref:hexitol phosphatase HxpB n=1 Tax=Shewanella acanthi TaxID=2864212 RepID=UPI001C65D118|nr:hexitol phosphatase HxpB [Shewanella acanthi]QYJ79179.1 hexitol phosphatase HxpB [Shewanella acanthi]